MHTPATTLAGIVAVIRGLGKEAKVDKEIRPGPRGRYPNSLLLTTILLQSLFGYDSEAAFLRYLGKHHTALFPRLPERSWYNRKRKRLQGMVAEIHALLLTRLGVERVDIRIVDATGIPVVKLHRARRCRSFARNQEVNYGYCAAKKTYYYGEKLTLMVTPKGIPMAHTLTPANRHDARAFKERIEVFAPACQSKTVVGDLGCYDGTLDAEMAHRCKAIMVTPEKRRHQKRNTWWQRQILRGRTIIETVFEQLQDHMRIDHTRAKSQQGLETRIQSILTGFTLGIYVNVLNGREPLAIKSLVT